MLPFEEAWTGSLIHRRSDTLGGHHGVDRQALRLVRRPAPHGLLYAGEGRSAERSTLRLAHQGDDRGGTLLRLSHRGLASGLQQEHGAENLSAQGLASPEAGRRHAAPHPSRSICRHSPERALVHGYRPHLDRQRRLGFAGAALEHALIARSARSAASKRRSC